MKISLNWLSNYIDVEEFKKDTEQLSVILTSAGLEVDGIEDMAKDLNHVVVGQIKTLDSHPDADKLTLCQVDVGQEGLQQIICGAKNHKAGDRVVVALPGAVLPGNFKIKKSKIRGVESLGMLCSDSELGFAEDSEGIRILPEDAPVGQAFADYSGLDDIVFNLSVTSNRADCLSHLGLARELSCILNRPLKNIENSYEKYNFKTSDTIKVELKDNEKCPRYMALLIKDVKVEESPAWLKSYLKNVDVNSVNNVVDITNYVMLEYGQPMHAFDLKHLEGSQINIQSLTEKTEFVSLDGTKYELDNNELAICDSRKVVALAGIVGGQNSGISESTQNLVLEVAHFKQKPVRKTSRALGIDTDSSYRFSRGTDINEMPSVVARAAHLIEGLCGGKVSGEVIDCYPNKITKKDITVEFAYVSERLGYSINGTEFVGWMKRLGCEVIKQDEASVTVQAPSWRHDIEIKEDLVEEHCRLNGYDKIPETLPPLSYEPLKHDASYLQNKHTYQFFAKQGFHQAVNYNFVNKSTNSEFIGDVQAFKDCGFIVGDQEVLLQNPLSEEYNMMRPSLFASLFKNVLTNYRSGLNSSKIFELGRVFADGETGYKESNHIGLVSWGKTVNLWTQTSSPQVLHLKAVMENFLTSLKAKSWSWKKWDSKVAFMHPARTATLFFQGKNVGYITELHPKIKQDYKIREDVAFAEFNSDLLMQGFPRKPKVTEVSKYPAVERDFSFVVDKAVVSDEIKTFIQKSEKKLIVKVEVIDSYSGEKLPADKHSLTYRVLFQDKEKTLTEDIIKKMHSEILNKVQEKFQ